MGFGLLFLYDRMPSGANQSTTLCLPSMYGFVVHPHASKTLSESLREDGPDSRSRISLSSVMFRPIRLFPSTFEVVALTLSTGCREGFAGLLVRTFAILVSPFSIA